MAFWSKRSFAQSHSPSTFPKSQKEMEMLVRQSNGRALKEQAKRLVCIGAFDQKIRFRISGFQKHLSPIFALKALVMIQSIACKARELLAYAQCKSLVLQVSADKGPGD